MAKAITSDASRTFQRTAWWLGLAGLIPFVAASLVLLGIGINNPLADPIINAFRGYGIAILSFLGGIRWGLALVAESHQHRHDSLSLVLSVVPSLIAWCTIFMSPIAAIGTLLTGFCAQGAWDTWSAQAGKLPAWFSPLRITLTLVVALSHIVLFSLMATA